MLSLIACCRMTITSRYHFSLFSAVQKVPFLALKRSDKIDDLCWDLRWDYGVALGHLGDLSLAEMLSEMETKRASLVARLEENARKMRQRTLKNRVAIAALAKETAK
jgi:polysaccharide pyruvyl transferase WcaK-like protein